MTSGPALGVAAAETPRPAAPGGASRLSTRMTAFALAWAVATLLHIWSIPDSQLVLAQPSIGSVTPTAAFHVLAGAAAIVVLLRPWDVRPLILLCVLQLGSAAVDLPALSNHWLLAALVAFALLTALGSVAAGSVAAGRGGLDLAEAERRFVPAAVATLAVAYGFAAFSKLNTGFLALDGSCGRYLIGQALGSFGLDALAARPGVGWAGIVTALLAEGSVAVLLLFRATRPYGVLIGVLFHGLVGLNLATAYFDFSGVLYALFLLALPAGFAPWLRGRVRAPRWALPALAAVAGLLCLVHWLWPSPFPAPPLAVGRMLFWAAYVVLALAAVAGFLWAARGRAEAAGERARPARVPALLLIAPLLAAVNGLTPYLELKTDFSWTMYSNLVTAEGASNHLIVPRTLPLVAEQRRLVTIVRSDDPGLRWYAASGARVPLLNLRAYAADHPRSEVVYEVGGVRRAAVPMSADPLLNRPPSFLRERLQVYRSVPAGRPSPCVNVKGALH